MLACESTIVGRSATEAYVNIRQHTSLYMLVSSVTGTSEEHASAYVSMRAHRRVYVSIREHTRSIMPHNMCLSSVAYVDTRLRKNLVRVFFGFRLGLGVGDTVGGPVLVV